MIPGLIKSKHVQNIWAALKAAGVEGMSIQLKGVGSVPLSRGLLLEFLCLLRGNKVDQLVGPWVHGLKDILKVRATVAPANGKETSNEGVDGL